MEKIVSDRINWLKCRGVEGVLPDTMKKANDGTTSLVGKFLAIGQHIRTAKFETVQHVYFDNAGKPHVSNKAKLEELNDEIVSLEVQHAALGEVLDALEAMGSPFISEVAGERRGLLATIDRLERVKAAALAAAIRRKSYRSDAAALEDPKYREEAADCDNMLTVNRAKLDDVTAKLVKLNALMNKGGQI